MISPGTGTSPVRGAAGEALSCLPFTGAGLWDLCCPCVCVRVHFLDLFNGFFSLYRSIKPLLFIFTRHPLHCLPLFSEQIRSLQLFAQKTINPQRGPASPGTPAAGWAQVCHRLTCPWPQRSGGERGREVGAGSGDPCGPGTALLPEHRFAWKQPAGAAALCRRAVRICWWFDLHGQFACKDQAVS